MASGMMAGGYLLDTNVVSELCKPKPDVKVNQFVLGLPTTHISVMTLAELQAGIAQSASKGNNVQRLNAWFSKLQGQAGGIIMLLLKPLCEFVGMKVVHGVASTPVGRCHSA